MLVALGFVEVSGGQTGLTPAGRQFVETNDVELVQRALVDRVMGVKEIIEEIHEGPRTVEQLQQTMANRGLVWETTAQIYWRLNWLESAGLVENSNGEFKVGILTGLDESPD